MAPFDRGWTNTSTYGLIMMENNALQHVASVYGNNTGMGSLMIRRSIVQLILFTYCLWLAGCGTTRKQTIIRDEFQDLKDEKIIAVTLEDGDFILFDPAGGRYVQRNVGQTSRLMIVGNTWDKGSVEIDAEKVLDAQIEKSEVDVGRTLLLVFLGLPVIALALLILLLIMFPPRF